LAWLASLVATPFLVAECNAKLMHFAILWKSCADLGLAVVGLLLLRSSPSFVGYFAVFVVSQGVTGAVCGLALNRKKLAALSALNAIVAFSVLVGSA
jgi:hypothetical protein